MSKSQNFFPLNAVNFTSTRWSPLLDGHASHPLHYLNSLFLLSLTCIEGSLKADPLNKTKNNLLNNATNFLSM